MLFGPFCPGPSGVSSLMPDDNYVIDELPKRWKDSCLRQKKKREQKVTYKEKIFSKKKNGG